VGHCSSSGKAAAASGVCQREREWGIAESAERVHTRTTRCGGTAAVCVLLLLLLLHCVCVCDVGEEGTYLAARSQTIRSRSISAAPQLT